MTSPRVALIPLCLTAASYALTSCGGNSTTSTHIAGPPAKLETAAGNQQAGVVNKELPNPLVVRVVDANSNPVQGQLVNFRVTSGGGNMFAGAGISNADGLVQDRWTLGTSTADSQQVEARAVDNVTGAAIVFAVFSATPLADVPNAITKEAGDGQVGTANTALPALLQVIVRDNFGNPVPGDSVTWAIQIGGGLMVPAKSLTNGFGITSSQWTLGPGSALQSVSASTHGLSTTFSAATQAASTPTQLLAVGGNGQTGTVGLALADSAAVRVVDQNGINVAGVQITWGAAVGSGSVNPTVTATNALGLAKTSWTLGTVSGPQTATASATGLTTVNFTATALASFVISTISAGGIYLDEHTCVLTTQGKAYCWGAGSHGRLGNGSTSSSNVPVLVSGNLTFAAITAGGYHTCGLTQTGLAYCWGRNDSLQLGNGSSSDATTPQLVSGGLTFTKIDAGAFHTCGLIAGGTAYCWGANAFGQLGDGTNQNRSVPTAVAGAVSFANIAAGGSTQASHSCGTTTAGVGYCWGSGGFGQLGTGSGSNRNTPGLVTAAVSFSGGVDAGGYYSCGKSTAGAVVCWGYNAYGQLTYAGPGSLDSVSVGGQTSCGIQASGDGYCWGWGRYGARGDGIDAEPSTNPTLPVQGNRHWTQISPAGYHTCGVTTQGEAFCWGYGSDGQLGNGSNTFSLQPSKVVSP